MIVYARGCSNVSVIYNNSSGRPVRPRSDIPSARSRPRAVPLRGDVQSRLFAALDFRSPFALSALEVSCAVCIVSGCISISGARVVARAPRVPGYSNYVFTRRSAYARRA